MLKQVVFKMSLELFRAAKTKAVQNDMNMTQYIVSLIQKDLQTEAKNRSPDT